MQMQCWQQYNRVNNNTNAATVVGGQQQPDINSVTRDDTKTECCSRVCNTRTQSLLRESVSFCSIGCVLATKFGGEARMHEISKTQNSFLEIPPRYDLIILFANF